MRRASTVAEEVRGQRGAGGGAANRDEGVESMSTRHGTWGVLSGGDRRSDPGDAPARDRCKVESHSANFSISAALQELRLSCANKLYNV